MMIQRYANSKAEKWYQSLLAQPETFPFSFSYEGQNYKGFGNNMQKLHNDTRSQEGKETTEQSWVLKNTIKITLDTAFYPDYGAFEWTVWFENVSSQDSGRLEKLESCLQFEGERPVLKGILGDHANLYQPYSYDLQTLPVHFVSDSGRATHINFPYFNLEYGTCGAMLAIGWAGTWTADFRFDGYVTTYTARSVNHLCTYLKPGEQVRTALFVVAPYTVRNENYATNYWRSWFLHCNLPAADVTGKPLGPFSTCCLASDTGLPNSDGSISERHFTWRPSLEKMIAEDVKVDYRWFDAGWYVAPDGSSPESDWWGTVGTWELDPAKWPGNSFLESTEFARQHGMKTLMWFEPERVTDPESLAARYGYQMEWAIRQQGNPAISNNIGDPACLEWITQRVCKVLRENKVEMYREDNNCDPAILWDFLDEQEGEGRKGITECKFIQGHYKMWDDIIACTSSYGGDRFVDSCASGGGRNDLESMRRGVPNLRSDNDRTSAALRLSMTTAFNKWIPFCGASTKEKLGQLDPTGRSDVYTWRASYLPVLNVSSQFVQDPNQDFDMLRFGLKEWKKVNPYLLKDFYVLTPWHNENDKSGFTSYSFYDPETEKGLILLFRMEDCSENSLNIALPYAQPQHPYRLIDEDSGETWTVSGQELCQGMVFRLASRRSARLIWIAQL